MKRTVFLYLMLIVLLSCSTAKQKPVAHAAPETPCPPNFECGLETLKNKSLDIKTDDTGHTYFNLKDTPGKTVYRYTIKKITDAKLADAGYSETIIFEADSNAKTLSLVGNDIVKAKMLFNVACFCRGKAGVYKIEEGTLALANNKLHIELPELVERQMMKVVDVLIR